MATASEGTDAAGLAPPADGARGERVEQNLAQIAALHLGPSSRTVVASVEEDAPIAVEEPHRLTAFEDEALEFVHQAGRLQSELPVVVVDVEHPPLRARQRRGLRFVHCGGMPWRWRTRARVRPPRPAPMIVTGVFMVTIHPRDGGLRIPRHDLHAIQT